jgi:lysophospholipase L1-like esterase
MVQKLLPPKPAPDTEAVFVTSARRARGRRLARARDAFVAIVVCLGLWTVLLAPVLERNAESGPLGSRRNAALAVLRPITHLAGALGIAAVSDRVLTALGDDPEDQAGGELVLPDIEPLPPLPTVAPAEPTPHGVRGGPGGIRGGAMGLDRSQEPRPEPKPEPTAPAIPPVRTPSATSKLRVAVVGDSLSQGLGPGVIAAFDPRLSRVLSLGRQSTGLAREDYFNWPRAMRQIEREFRPDLVFIMLGTNDNQAQVAADGDAIPVGSVAWVDAYRERVRAFVGEATSQGTHVVWVGIPIVQDRRRWTFYRRVNAIYEEVATEDPLATFVDTWDRFSTRDGSYTAFLRNERGVLQDMRAGDGVHFTPTGYAFLARISVRAADAAWEIPREAVTFRLG